MDIQERFRRDVTILALRGRLVAGDGGSTLRARIERTLESGARKIVFDLSRVSYIDTAGIDELTWCRAYSESRGGAVKLLNVSSGSADVMAITQLIAVFEVYEDEGEAIASFG